MQNPNHEYNLNLGHLREWTSALRSGAFQQGENYLCFIPEGATIKQHCCLGVGSQIMGLEMGSRREGTGTAYTYGPGASVSYPPVEFNAWLGVGRGTIEVDAPSLDEPIGSVADICWQLDVLNDQGFTFDQIADLIDYFGVRV